MALFQGRRPHRHLRRRHGPPRRAPHAERGAAIVVGTPGRLKDHLERGALDLSALKAVVLDEADEMLDMGFAEDLTFILDSAPAERRTLMFSATLARDIVQLARTYQRDAIRIDTVAGAGSHADIEYKAIRVAPNEVELGVVNVLRYFEAPGALVFANTRERVKHLTASLRERGFAVVGLSGELTQSQLAPRRCRLCVTATPASASPPTSPPAASTCPTWVWSSTPKSRSTRPPFCTVRAVPAAPARRASPSCWSPTPVAARSS
jgi:hypothetical protein